MREKNIKEGLADLADMAERDHEVQMARADLYKIAKYAIKLHDMLKNVSEREGLEGWQQAKITKASDYLSSVFHNLDYDMKFGDGQNMDPGDVAEGNISRKLMKALTFGPQTDSPKDMQAGIRKMSDKELLDLMRGDDVEAPSGSARSLQQKLLKREIRRRGIEDLGEGKSPHKKGSKAYKKQMAAKHASMGEDSYKKSLAARLAEKAVSKSQQQAAGAALAAKRGDAPKSKLKGASKEMMSMSTKELEKFAGTKHKGLPKNK